MPALREGQKFERYRIIRLLGRGVAGESYEAEDTALFRKVVLKLLQPWAPFSDAARRQFFREMQRLSLLNHRYLAPVLDYGEVHGNLYVARRFFSSGSLLSSDGRLWFSPPLEPAAAITYAHQLAQALQHIHDSGYLHGAVGLANIMVLRGPNIEREPDYAPFLLADVGLASFVRRFGRPVSALLPVTAAPEQIGQRVTPASDQFALAVILYLWISGRPPYLGSPAEIEQAKLSETFPSLMSLTPRVSLAQEGIIRRALSVYPEDRYPSILAFADALLATLKQAAPPSVPAPIAAAAGATSGTTAEAPSEAASEVTSETASEALSALSVPSGETATASADGQHLPSEEPAGSVGSQEPAPLTAQTQPAQVEAPVEDQAALTPALPAVSEADGGEGQQTAMLLPADDERDEPGQEEGPEVRQAGPEGALNQAVAAEMVSEGTRLAEEPLAGLTVVAEGGELAGANEQAAQEEPAPAATYLETLLQATRTPAEPLSAVPQERTEQQLATYNGQASVGGEGLAVESEQNGTPFPPGEQRADEHWSASQETSSTSAIALLAALSDAREVQGGQGALPEPARGEPAAVSLPGEVAQQDTYTHRMAEAPVSPASSITSSGQSACLLVIPPAAREPYVVPIVLNEVKIGRAGDSDLLLEHDQRVSRRHAYLRREGTHFLMQDGDNAEGVFVNGRRLAPHASQILQEGDRIRIGDYELIFYWDTDQGA